MYKEQVPFSNYSQGLMKQFVAQNYTAQPLYPELWPKECQGLADLSSYMPKQTKSIKFAHRQVTEYDAPVELDKIENSWTQLDPFTACMINNEGIIYAGGPVIAMDWLPLFGRDEDSTSEQILAIVCKEFDDFYMANSTKRFNSLIQIWSCGSLDGST
jgi:hypothetical protein